MTDLHCPAYDILVAPESILGDPAPAAAGKHVVGVFIAGTIAGDARARGAAARLARPSGCAVEVLPAAASGETLRDSLDELADLNRGHTICVVAPEAMIQGALRRKPALEGAITVAIDGSGWRVVEPGAD